MKTGDLKYRIEIYKNIGNENNPVLELFKSVRAAIQYKTGDTILQSYQIFNTKSQTVRIRRIKDIDELMYIKYKNEYYQISSIQEIKNTQIIEIVLSNYRD